MTDEEPNPWAAIVGPCYTATSVARTLGWTKEEVATAVASLTLLELQTDDGALLYPAFQVRDGQVVGGLGETLRALSAGTRSTWTWAQWMNAAVNDETGRPAPSVIDQLRAGHLDEYFSTHNGPPHHGGANAGT